MNYAVHLYTQVRVKVTGVEAENAALAMQKAEEAVAFHELLDNKSPRCSVTGGMSVVHVEWTEGAIDCALIDSILDNAEVDYPNEVWMDADGQPLVDGKTADQRKAVGYDRAKLFMQELQESVETLTGIAEQHGPRTLADLMYLHSAILNDGFIDHYPDESQVLNIARALPSGEQWMKFVKVEYMAQPVA